jgi:hypothetical protein
VAPQYSTSVCSAASTLQGQFQVQFIKITDSQYYGIGGGFILRRLLVFFLHARIIVPSFDDSQLRYQFARTAECQAHELKTFLHICLELQYIVSGT